MRLFLSYHAFCLYLYLCRYILSYDLKSFSSFVDSLLLKPSCCFSLYNIQSFSPFSCLIVAFLQSCVTKAMSLACQLNSQSRSSLFCCCLLSIIKCTLSSCTFHFFKPVFLISWSSSLTNKFHSFDLFYSPSLSSSRSKFSTFIVFNSVLLVSLFCHYSSSLQLFGLLLSIVTQWSLVFKFTFFLPPKILYFFSKKKKL